MLVVGAGVVGLLVLSGWFELVVCGVFGCDFVGLLYVWLVRLVIVGIVVWRNLVWVLVCGLCDMCYVLGF